MSPLQYKIFKFIQQYITTNGYSPTLLEIAKGIGISPRSKGLISRYVHVLVKSGWLTLDHKGYRNINIPLPRLQFPVVGRIAAGSAIEPIDQQEILDIAAALWEEGCFVLEVKGNSMNGEGILDGDNIICKQQATANEGEIVVALIDKIKATLKRIHYLPESIIQLEAANPDFPPQVYAKERITIQGVFMGLVRLPNKKCREALQQQKEEVKLK
jgi:repressor LexA